MGEAHPVDISGRLTAIIIDALRVDPAIVTPEARIFNDLGAESLDVLDIRFQIEHVFAIKIDQDELNRIGGTGLTEAQFKEYFTVARLSDFIVKKMGCPS